MTASQFPSNKADLNGSLQTVARSEFIVGGQKSGKSRRAEALAQQWLDQSPNHQALLVATALPCDAEMAQRIARHQQDRALRVPRMAAVEQPLDLAEALHTWSHPERLVVVDCLTLWLTNWLMPATGVEPDIPDSLQSKNVSNQAASHISLALNAPILIAIEQSKGPVVIVSNEIGLGVIPLGAQVRHFVDALGLLNQQVAAVCERATLMTAGLPITLKDLTSGDRL